MADGPVPWLQLNGIDGTAMQTQLSCRFSRSAAERSSCPARRCAASLAFVLTAFTAITDAQTHKGGQTADGSASFQELGAESAAAVAATTFVSADEVGPGRASAAFQALTPVAVPATGTLGNAGPYPLNLVVSGFTGTIGRLAVRLHDVSHTFPGDLDVLLVGPGGQKVILMSDAAGGDDVEGVHLTFQDGVGQIFEAPPLSSGTYRPSDWVPGDSFPEPAPAGPYSTSFADFTGTNPNGTWSLYVVDDSINDIGSIGGFSLLISPAFANNTPFAIPDTSTIDSPLMVSGLTAPITKVTVSFHIAHTYDNDLDVYLVGPDGTSVELTTDNGGESDDYGTSCANRTSFDDLADTNIGLGTAPFAGTFRPEGLLSAFNGKISNGLWSLRVTDDLGNDVGTLHCWSLAISQNEDTTLQAPTSFVATSVVGNQVTLRWTPPGFGVAPTSYMIEGGVNPGEVLASLATGSPSPIVTFAAPTGAFYVRARALAGAATSGASNEIRLFVNTPAAPSPPAVLQRTVDGTSLNLAWRNTFAGGAATSVVLDVTGSATTSIALGLAETASFTGVPGGTYTVSLRAINAAGGSGASNAVTITSPSACSGAPGAPSGFLAYKVGSTIFVTWRPAATGTAPTGFVLNVTGAFVGSFPTTGRGLSGAGGPGSYGLSVVATNSCGTSPATAVQTVTIP
ncbi:MAG: proprotein convertase P-domain-containing protein [Vicinamibacterales bacterium]